MHTLDTINAFIEDTGVIVSVAYLIARGQMLHSLFRRSLDSRHVALVGAVFGGIGLTEVIFPGDRYPYVTDTAIATLAVLTGDVGVGLVCVLVISLGALVLQPWREFILTTVQVLLAVGVAKPFRSFSAIRYSPWRGLLAGIATELAALAAYSVYCRLSDRPPHIWHGAISVFANGFGLTLMVIVINDAWLRVNSEMHRLDAERAKALAAQAQLISLRARIHPHFLYNVLASIAGLCRQSPEAEVATIQLSDLMRRTLEVSTTSSITLGTELEYVRTYLEIEQRRLGSRLSVHWDLDPSCNRALVPPLSVQTLVENAINHGVAPKIEPSSITVSTRNRGVNALVAVCDSGEGMPNTVRARITASAGQELHGLQLLSQQLHLLFGRSSRLRIFSRPLCGTLVVFSVPTVATTGT